MRKDVGKAVIGDENRWEITSFSCLL